MQHTFQHAIEQTIFPDNAVEIDLTITYEYTPPSRGQRGPHGEPLEPDAESGIEILSVTDEAGNDYYDKIGNLYLYSLVWDHLSKTFEQ